MKNISLYFFFIIMLASLSLYAEPKIDLRHATDMIEISQSETLPKAYGFYLIDNNNLIELPPTAVTTIIGLPLRALNIGYALDGISGDSSISIASNLPTIIIYQQNVDVNTLLLCDMVYVKTMEAQQFNIRNTDRRFFSTIYTKDYYDIVDINLWRPNNEIALRIEPIEGKWGMFKFIPENPLAPGNYVFYFKGELHKNKMIFSSDSGRKASAFYFNIKSDKTDIMKEGANEAKLKELLVEAKVAIISAKNYDIRYSAALNRIAASREKATLIIYLDKAGESLDRALEAAEEIMNIGAINLINESKLEIEKARERYKEGRAAYSEIMNVEKQLNSYTNEMPNNVLPAKTTKDSFGNVNIEETRAKLNNILEETLTLLRKARQMSNVKYIIQTLDKSIKNLDIAAGIASSLNDSDDMNVVQTTRDYINEARAKYSTSNSYNGIGEHKEAIKTLEKYLRK